MQSIMDELREIRWRKLAIERNYERAARLREQAGAATTKIRACGSRGTAEHDVMAAQIATLLDLENDLVAGTMDMELRLRDVEGAVDALPGAQSAIMRMRYLDGWQWRQIARAVHYTQRRCLQMHEDGVRNLGG